MYGNFKRKCFCVFTLLFSIVSFPYMQEHKSSDFEIRSQDAKLIAINMCFEVVIYKLYVHLFGKCSESRINISILFMLLIITVKEPKRA